MTVEQLNERVDELTVQHGEMLGRVMSLVNTTIKLHDVALTLQHDNSEKTGIIKRMTEMIMDLDRRVKRQEIMIMSQGIMPLE